MTESNIIIYRLSFDETKYFYIQEFGVFKTEYDSFIIEQGSDLALAAGVTEATHNDEAFKLLREYLKKHEVSKGKAHKKLKTIQFGESEK